MNVVQWNGVNLQFILYMERKWNDWTVKLYFKQYLSILIISNFMYIIKKMPTLFFILEWLGTISIVLAYFFTTTINNVNLNIIAILNLYGGFILSISCFIKKNWSVFVIEIIWTILAIYKLIDINIQSNINSIYINHVN